MTAALRRQHPAVRLGALTATLAALAPALAGRLVAPPVGLGADLAESTLPPLGGAHPHGRSTIP